MKWVAGSTGSCALIGLFLLATAALFSTVTLAQSASGQQKVVGGTYAELIEKADRQGGIQVLVSLDVTSAGEDSFNAGGRQMQPEFIASAQSNLVAKLRDVDARVLTLFDVFPIIHLNVDRAALLRLLTLPDVRYVQENWPDRPLDAASNAVINVAPAWAAGFDGTGWTVVVMDTGVQSSHPFLAGKVVAEACFSSFVSGQSNSLCPNGQSTSGGNPGQVGPLSGINCVLAGCEHGTAMSGIAVGSNYSGGPGYDGVGRGAKLISLQVFSDFSGAPGSYISDQLAAFQYVLTTLVPDPAFKIAAISMAFGDSNLNAAACDTDVRKAPIDALRAAGVATIIAAGNGGSSGGISSPACISTAISVSATDNSDNVAGFSNRANFMSLWAPGVVVSTSSSSPANSFVTLSGTSVSTAHVAGAWAVLKQKRPTTSVTQVLTALQTTGAPISIDGFTKPRINVGAAVNALVSPPVLTGAASRKTHGTAGTFDLPLSIVASGVNHNPTTEPRQGPGQIVVVSFDKPINAATVTVMEGSAIAAAPTFSGNSVVVALTGVTNLQYVTVSLTNVASTDGGTGGSASVRIGFLAGDVNRNRVVTVADLGLVNAVLAQPVTAANYLKDVNASGTLSVADKGITNAYLTKGLPPP